MKITIRDIKPAGFFIDSEIKPEAIGLAENDLKCLSTIKINAQVHKAGDSVLATSQVEGKYEFQCARCLEPIIIDTVKKFDHVFEIDETTEYVDLGEDIRQELILAFSPVVLCKKDCKGICPGCGANLNNEKCKCEK